ncbi:hypothetical protein D6789_00990 [Candidatus Woesearchaeota archaeon]|nr:MAG: hypothetical protein D6789_00990 [Candidatus Woesearchaeota archaeon]
MKRLLYVVLTLALLACAPRGFVCPDGSVVASPEACRSPATIPEATQPVAGVEPTEPMVDKEVDKEVEKNAAAPVAPTTPSAPTTYSPEISGLLSLPAKRVKSMAFLYAPIIEKDAGTSRTTSHKYFILGDAARVDVGRRKGVSAETNIDTVYLDFAEKSARAFCLDGRSYVCAVKGREFPAAFSDFAPKLPTEWLAEMPVSAKITSEQNIEGRTAKIIEFEKEGQFYRYAVDSYTGVPLRVHIFSDPERRQLIGGIEYHDIAFNSVTPEDVLPPN